MLGTSKQDEKESDDNFDVFECKGILKNLSSKQYRVGKELVLLKYGQVFQLEELRAERIMEVIIELQAISRMTLIQKEVLEMKIKTQVVLDNDVKNDEKIPQEMLNEIKETREKYAIVLEKTKILTDKYNKLKEENAKLVDKQSEKMELLTNEISTLSNEKNEMKDQLKSKEESLNLLKKENETKINSIKREIEETNQQILGGKEKEIKMLKDELNSKDVSNSSKNSEYTEKYNKIKESNEKEFKKLEEKITELKREEKKSIEKYEKKIKILNEEIEILKHNSSNNELMKLELKNLEDQLRKSANEILILNKTLKEEQLTTKKEEEYSMKLQKDLDEKISSLKQIQFEKENQKKSKSGLTTTVIFFSFSVILVSALSFYAGNKIDINKFF